MRKEKHIAVFPFPHKNSELQESAKKTCIPSHLSFQAQNEVYLFLFFQRLCKLFSERQICGAFPVAGTLEWPWHVPCMPTRWEDRTGRSVRCTENFD